jgi:hypothetical protein
MATIGIILGLGVTLVPSESSATAFETQSTLRGEVCDDGPLVTMLRCYACDTEFGNGRDIAKSIPSFYGLISQFRHFKSPTSPSLSVLTLITLQIIHPETAPPTRPTRTAQNLDLLCSTGHQTDVSTCPLLCGMVLSFLPSLSSLAFHSLLCLLPLLSLLSSLSPSRSPRGSRDDEEKER